jgi:hypothetical protein
MEMNIVLSVQIQLVPFTEYTGFVLELLCDNIYFSNVNIVN